MGKPGWGYHYTPCDRAAWGSVIAAAAVVAGAVVLARVWVYLAIGAGVFAVVMAPVVWVMMLPARRPSPVLAAMAQARRELPARVPLAIGGRRVVPGQVLTASQAPAMNAAVKARRARGAYRASRRGRIGGT